MTARNLSTKNIFNDNIYVCFIYFIFSVKEEGDGIHQEDGEELVIDSSFSMVEALVEVDEQEHESIEDLLAIHMRRENKRWFCNLCTRSMRDKCDARRHLESKHFPSYGAYACSHCGKQVNSKASLRSHQQLCLKERNSPGGRDGGMGHEMI